MAEQEINIENLTIDIYVDSQKNAQQFLNKSVEELKQLVLPEIERQLMEMNVLSDNKTSFSPVELNLGSMELDVHSRKNEWRETVGAAISKSITEEYHSQVAFNEVIEKPGKHLSSDADKSNDLVELFVYFLKTGVLPQERRVFGITSFSDLDEKIRELDPVHVWKRVVPSLQQNAKRVTRLVRQSSPDLWDTLVGGQFSGAVQEFILNWIRLYPTHEERTKTIVLQFLIGNHEFNAQREFVPWKKAIAAYITSHRDKIEVVNIILSASQIALSREQTSGVFRTQWEEFIEEIARTKEFNADTNPVQGETSSDAQIEVKEKEPFYFPDPKEILIENAGIVLLHPFFPSVFSNLELLNEENKWVDEETRVKAIYILHYLATGETEVSEDQLLIEKLLTGFPLDEVLPVIEEKEIVSEVLETQMTELLEVVHENWKPMKKCTWDGLRNDFLMRPAELQQIDEIQYKLIIKPHMLDVLLPMKNWGISMVKYSWMDGFVFVEWGE